MQLHIEIQKYVECFFITYINLAVVLVLANLQPYSAYRKNI